MFGPIIRLGTILPARGRKRWISSAAQEVKRRYKALAKTLHPDTNGGSKKAEERLKHVNQAYSTLKALFS